MYVLLEPGMKIKPGDQTLINDRWRPADTFMSGPFITSSHFLFRRKIDRISELVELYTDVLKQEEAENAG